MIPILAPNPSLQRQLQAVFSVIHGEASALEKQLIIQLKHW